MADDWPATKWQFTAPESYVVRYGADADGREAFKYALKELVARRALLLEPVEKTAFLGRRRQASALTEGPAAASVKNPSLLRCCSSIAGSRSDRSRAFEPAARS